MWIGQSQPIRRGCHYWELQDERFAFCEQFYLAFSQLDLKHALAACDQARMIIIINKTKVLFFPEIQGSVYCDRQYTAADGDVKVSCCGIHEWRKAEQGDWYTEWQSKRSSAWALSLWWQNGSFQATQSCQFLNRCSFRSYSVVKNLRQWLKGYYRKWKRQRWDFAKNSGCDPLWFGHVSRMS